MAAALPYVFGLRYAAALQSPVSPELKSQVNPVQQGTASLQASVLKLPLTPHSTQCPRIALEETPHTPPVQNPL